MHPECGSHIGAAPIISKFDHGGPRPNSGGRREGAGRKPIAAESPQAIAGRTRGIAWYCIETEPKAERAVVAQIGAIGIVAMAPEYLGKKRVREVVRGVVKVVDRDVLMAAFPRYVFAQFDARDGGWRRIATLRHVKRLMGPEPERPMAVPEREMIWVIEQFGVDGAQRVPAKPAAPISPGATVRVLAGPLAGYVAQVVQSNGRTVSIAWAGRHTTMAQAAVELMAVCERRMG